MLLRPRSLNIVYPNFIPSELFLESEIGFYYDFSVMPSLWQNSTRTTPVADFGDPVGYVDDLSGNGYNALQATAAARPFFGRQPRGGARNLLINTSTLTTRSVTVTAAQQTISFTGTGTVTLSGVSTAGPLIGTGGNDRVSLTFTPTAGTLTLTVSGSATDGQLELGATTTDYQRVGASLSTDVTESGVQDVWFLRFDGADDVMSCTIPAITGGTIVIAGTNGIWIDAITVGAGTFSIGATTYTSGPAGILALVGKVIGAMLIDTTLAGDDLTSVRSYYKSLGAPGYFQVSGAELVANGTNPTDTTGWTPLGANSAVSAVSSTLRVEVLSGSRADAATPLVTVVGGRYLVSVELTNKVSPATSGAFYAGTGPGSGNLMPTITIANPEIVRAILAPTTTTSYLTLKTNGTVGGATDYNSVSVKQITLNTGA